MTHIPYFPFFQPQTLRTSSTLWRPFSSSCSPPFYATQKGYRDLFVHAEDKIGPDTTSLATSAYTASSDAQNYYSSQANYLSLYNQYVASQEFANISEIQASVDSQAQAAGASSVLFITDDTGSAQDINMQQQNTMCQNAFNGDFITGFDSQGNAYRACIIP